MQIKPQRRANKGVEIHNGGNVLTIDLLDTVGRAWTLQWWGYDDFVAVVVTGSEVVPCLWHHWAFYKIECLFCSSKRSH